MNVRMFRGLKECYTLLERSLGVSKKRNNMHVDSVTAQTDSENDSWDGFKANL